MEIEVKVLNVDCEKIKNKLESLNAKLVKDEFQENFIYALPKSVEGKGYVRIRTIHNNINNENKVLLCSKKIISQDKFRKVDEFEFEVSSFDECKGFLSSLNVEFLSQENKSRISYEFLDSLIEFDKWDDSVFPYPYIEIEVENEDRLDEIINILDIPKENVTSKGLLEIKKEMGI